ncbi:hypothetical protein [Spirosoma gilvum]
MKSLFPYLVMCVLFIAGNYLVERQQQYKRSNQEAAPVQSAPFAGVPAYGTNAPKMQLTSSPVKHMVADRRALMNTLMQ